MNVRAVLWCVALAAPLGCSPPPPVVEIVLRLPAGASADDAARARAVLQRRLEDVKGAQVAPGADAGALAVRLPKGADPAALTPLLVRTGRLEIAPVDEGALALADDAALPEGVARRSGPWRRPNGDPVDDAHLTLPAARRDDVRALLALAPPRALRFGPAADPFDARGPALDPSAWRTWVVDTTSVIDNADVADAHAAVQEETGMPYVDLRFTRAGAQRFAALTGANVGRRLAILVEDRVTSAPVVMEAIPGGRVQITLDTRDTTRQRLEHEAEELARALRGGALPAPLVVESVTALPAP